MNVVLNIRSIIAMNPGLTREEIIKRVQKVVETKTYDSRRLISVSMTNLKRQKKIFEREGKFYVY